MAHGSHPDLRKVSVGITATIPSIPAYPVRVREVLFLVKKSTFFCKKKSTSRHTLHSEIITILGAYHPQPAWSCL